MNMLLKGLVGIGLGLGLATVSLAQDQAQDPAATEQSAPAAQSTEDEAAPADDTAEEPASEEGEPAAETDEAEEVSPSGDEAAEADAEGEGAESEEGDEAAHDGEEGHDGEEASHTPHYPLRKPMHVDWSFAGPFGHYDIGQLQRGLKVYKEVCSACHGMTRVAFRDLEELGYSEEQVKAFAADYEVEDGPDADGEMFTRTAIGSDYFPSPFPNEAAAAASNNGAAPPDFSLLAKARAVERGFPWFIFDIFTGYAENGPDYIYSLLHGYDEEQPEHIELPDGVNYNPYFISAAGLAMAKPIDDDMVEYDDGSPQTLEQYSRDISAFMMWAAEPKLEQRKKIGLRVMLFLVLFGALLWLTKRKVWHGVKH
ncbi:cytochrome c1 [Notoacmeibacter sp. MSK16QG-6]|uniref:cytochrome c1 n=1 Tax=Notoacmeibacter sp. MSK16QG-6 TaxID=2957982 RepID=UPI00209FB727|nr:cytochrome c1 [Notoacmeibacter sp. MSK16QG-6]MCP1199880.1 cytochrome c1 [Notoacmeibacter sp. MSK16QG-6]